MNNKMTTREILIEAAGQLFAENGFDAVSTRMIAEQAGVKLSAIHYHFGSKEKLYAEACLTAHKRAAGTTFEQIIDENKNLMNTREGQAEIVRTQVFRSFHHFLQADRAEWETKIILKEIVTPTSAMKVLTETIFKPDVESSMSFYSTVKPGASDEDAAAWSDLLYSMLIFYKIARKAIEMARTEPPLSDHFYRTAATKVARAMVLEAGLPLPADLQN